MNAIGRTRSCRSEEHTSELQSRLHLVCRLLLEKKNDRGVCRAGGLATVGRRARELDRAADRARRERAVHGVSLFFFNYPAATEIYTLSLHDALPIYKVM